MMSGRLLFLYWVLLLVLGVAAQRHFSGDPQTTGLLRKNDLLHWSDLSGHHVTDRLGRYLTTGLDAQKDVPQALVSVVPTLSIDAKPMFAVAIDPPSQGEHPHQGSICDATTVRAKVEVVAILCPTESSCVALVTLLGNSTARDLAKTTDIAKLTFKKACI